MVIFHNFSLGKYDVKVNISNAKYFRFLKSDAVISSSKLLELCTRTNVKICQRQRCAISDYLYVFLSEKQQCPQMETSTQSSSDTARPIGNSLIFKIKFYLSLYMYFTSIFNTLLAYIGTATSEKIRWKMKISKDIHQGKSNPHQPMVSGFMVSDTNYYATEASYKMFQILCFSLKEVVILNVYTAL